MKKVLFSLMMLVAIPFATHAQWCFEMSADVQSRYVWRGQSLGGNSVSLQPGATLSYGNLALDLWGAFSVTGNEYQELDWTLSYTLFDEAVRLQVTDYSFPLYSPTYHWFDYAQTTTDHVIEAGLQVAVPSTHLSLGVFTNLYGNDARNANGDILYSTYAELAYSLPWDEQKTDFDFALGCALNGTSAGGFYGNDGFDVVNVSVGATREFEFSPSFKLPFYGRLVANPCASKMWFVCGTTFAF